jgi:ArsR family transcriptional regulator, arsenate/arsenite/antimonite-responsive transcriptional repressor
MMEDPEAMARIFQALSAATRVRLLCLLKDRSLSVGEIAARLDVTQGAVSQHLRILREASLVQAERRGYHVHYHVLGSALDQCRQALECILQCQGPRSPAAGKRRPLAGTKTARTLPE